MGEKETMSGDALRKSSDRGTAIGEPSGRMENIGSSGQDGVGVEDDSAAPNLGSSGQERKGGFLPGAGQELDPRDVATGQSSGRMENIGSSGMDTGPDASAAPNLGSSGQERSSMSGEAGRVAPADLDGDGLPDIDAAAARGAAVSSVSQLGGQKPGGGAASAAYAREAADGPELATGDSDGDAPGGADASITKSRSNIKNN